MRSKNILEFDLGNCNFIFNNLHTLQFWMQEVIQAWKLAVGGQVLAHCCLQFISLLWSSTIWGWSKPWRHFFNSSAILGWSELWRHFFNASTSAEKKMFCNIIIHSNSKFNCSKMGSKNIWNSIKANVISSLTTYIFCNYFQCKSLHRPENCHQQDKYRHTALYISVKDNK